MNYYIVKLSGNAYPLALTQQELHEYLKGKINDKEYSSLSAYKVGDDV